MRAALQILALLLAMATCRSAPQHLQLAEGSFAYVNANGTQLLALDSLHTPSGIRAAVCSAARVFPVVFVRLQPRTPTDNGRQTGANFSRDSGDVFRVISGQAPAQETCYLSADSALLASAAPVSRAGSGACALALLHRIADAKHRDVLHCWPLGAAQPNVQIVAVQFVTVDTSALASVVVADGEKVFFRDFPAQYRGPEEDTWRVDDGGEFSPYGLEILFFCRLRGANVMALTWAGTEGEDSYLDVADSADAFRSLVSSYRYWGPD